MANMNINDMTDLWNTGGTVYSAIKMNVTNAASAAASKLLQLQVGGVDRFTVDKNGNIVAAGTIATIGIVTSGASVPSADDSASLGTSGTGWSDLFLSTGGVVNFGAGDVTITHSANALAFAGASGGYSFDAGIRPAANDGAQLGTSGTAWGDLFLATGGVIDFGAADVTISHAANALLFGGASNGYSFDATIKPAANDGAALGVSGTAWSDAFFATGATFNFASADVVITHSTGFLTVAPGDLRVTAAGTNAASVVTVGGTQTLTAKTLTNPVINGATINSSTLASPTISGTIGGGISVGGGVAMTGSLTSAAGNVQVNDLYSVRNAAPSTGVVFLGNTGHYLFFDGTNYALPAGSLSVGGNITATGGTITVSGTANYLSMTDTDAGATRYIHHNSGLIGFLGSGGGWALRTEDSGTLWSAQFGDFNTYWEGRCTAHQNAAVNRCVTSTQMAGETAFNRSGNTGKWQNSGYVFTGVQGTSSGGDATYYARQPQRYIANAGWAAAFPF